MATGSARTTHWHAPGPEGIFDILSGPMLLHLVTALLALSGDTPDFDSEVLPILSDHCFHCHGPDAGTRKAGLRLDSAEAILSAVEPGNVGASELHARITETDAEWVMPPPSFERPLTAEQVETLRAWIEGGAKWEAHWAYQPFSASELWARLPAGDAALTGQSWSSDPIDAFIQGRLVERGLSPSSAAEPAAWLRRVTLDLTGLPAALSEQDAFERAAAQASSDAQMRAVKGRVVDDLLTRRSHAEHRTREWLDVARYADTNGYQNDFRRDQWPWRDWVLEAFEANMPYDQFVMRQVAGDLMENADTSTILGTGFQRNHRTVTEAGSLDEEWRVENVADRAETTATAFLGLTLACARCHDHKYDQLTQKDYYGFYAFFNSIDEKGVYEETRGNVPPLISVPSADATERLAVLDAAIETLRGSLESLDADALERFEEWRTTWAFEFHGGLEDTEDFPHPRLYYSGDAETPESQALASLMPWVLAPEAIFLNGKADTAPSLGRAVSFEGDRPFTVSMWLKPEGHGAVYSRMVDDDTYQGADLVLLEDMRPAVHLIHSWPGNAIKVVGKEPLDRSYWQHVAVGYDGTGKAAGFTLYVNGVPQELTVEKDNLDGAIAVDEPLRLGTRRYAGDLSGMMLDFRVDRGTLDRGQVLRLARRRALHSKSKDFFAACFDKTLGDKKAGLRALVQQRAKMVENEIPTAMVLRGLDEPRETFVLDRGQYDQPTGDALRPDIPTVFGGLPEGAAPDRLGLAKWLVDPGNPLTARVAVNRVWKGFFGAGLTASLDDFGVRGDRPEYPEVLDHLAESFVESGWDLRGLERRIALSDVYGQASQCDAALAEMDPTNRLLARGPRHRLDAEIVRDQALAASGLLKPRFGGPPVKPYQPDGLWAELAGGAGQGAYVPSEGDDLFRRSVYTYRKRTVPHPTLTTFDAPGFELCTVQRSRTNTPLQALAVMNDVTYVEAARHLAKAMIDGAEDPGPRLTLGMRSVLGRRPSPVELGILEGALARHLADFGADPGAASDLLSPGATAPPESERTPEWAAYTMLASTLLNLDEAITKR